MSMDYKTFMKWQQKELEFLDTLDLTAAIKLCPDVDQLMSYIETNYQKYYEIEPFIFNCTTTDEFMDYLKSRYKVSFIEQIKYKIVLTEEE